MTAIETPAPALPSAAYAQAVTLLNQLRMTSTRRLSRSERQARRRWHNGEPFTRRAAMEWAGTRLVLRERGEAVPHAVGLDAKLHAGQPCARTPWVEREGAAAKLCEAVESFTREGPDREAAREGAEPSRRASRAKAPR